MYVINNYTYPINCNMKLAYNYKINMSNDLKRRNVCNSVCVWCKNLCNYVVILILCVPIPNMCYNGQFQFEVFNYMTDKMKESESKTDYYFHHIKIVWNIIITPSKSKFSSN